ncbi:MAG: extracellular catalytic domain type 1 short-chain-length polyhydroxyalkanoate depolymerase, partial [Hyphomicrobiaceae bacterium]
MSSNLVKCMRLGLLSLAAGRGLVAVFLCSIILSCSVVAQGRSASLQAITDFGPNPGELDMHIYVPDGHGLNPTLVVVLHGCMQEASDFDDETGLIALSEAHKFILLFPGQRRANNVTRCFNWFQERDNSRGRGESASIREMVRHTLAVYGVDPTKVYALGLSAGGSMTAVLMANYPELFQGGAIVAGTPYACNGPTLSTWTMWWWLHTWSGDFASATYACGLFINAPAPRSAEEWGDFVRASSGQKLTRWPRISIWHGQDDGTVHPDNQQELLKQWANVHGIDLTPEKIKLRNNVRHSIYEDTDGATRIETYEIENLGHAIAVDPGNGAENCG